MLINAVKSLRASINAVAWLRVEPDGSAAEILVEEVGLIDEAERLWTVRGRFSSEFGSEPARGLLDRHTHGHGPGD
jgi:hypothetical protein